MTGAVMVPILPCRSIHEQAEFYRALDFVESCRQPRPNPYLEVRRGGIVAAFRAGLTAHYGRVPTRGLPRLGALGTVADDVRQFPVTDPAGNQLRIGRRVVPGPQAPGRLGRALHGAGIAAAQDDPDLVWACSRGPRGAAGRRRSRGRGRGAAAGGRSGRSDR